jgi:hypothetical protein
MNSGNYYLFLMVLMQFPFPDNTGQTFIKPAFMGEAN